MTAPPAGLPWRVEDGDLLLAIRVVPRAARTAVDGVVTGPDGRPLLQIRLAAPPVEGAANEALVAFLAARLGLRRSAVTLVAGETARVKRLRLEGDVVAVEAALTAMAGQ